MKIFSILTLAILPVASVFVALAAPHHIGELFLVAPGDREDDVGAQLRPAFGSVGVLRVRCLPHKELEKHREAIPRFGRGLKPIEDLARSLV